MLVEIMATQKNVKTQHCTYTSSICVSSTSINTSTHVHVHIVNVHIMKADNIQHELNSTTWT